VVRQAAQGELPEWAVVTPRRREHIARVAALLGEWAAALRLPEAEQARWLAAGTLHDALRDAAEPDLRAILDGACADFPPPLLHGPAAAHRLGPEADEALRNAIRYHTLGHPDLDQLGRALYLADFLEPGRDFAVEWREALRARMPRELDAVLVDVLASRLGHLIEVRKPIRPETAAFWSAVVRGE
jgi:HD superfamily phosphohydrolase YqeK